MTKKEKLVEELTAYFGEEEAQELQSKTVKELESVLEAIQGSTPEAESEVEETAPVIDKVEVDPALIDGDGKELLFEGGPTLEKIEEWKSLFSDEIYLTEFDDDVFLWRPINRKEYKDVMKIQGADSFYKEERICERVVLFPANYSFMTMTAGKAGIPTVLSEYIMEKSGFKTQSGPIRL